MRHILGLLLFLSIALGQVNDKNFKQNVNGGMVVVVVTAEWQEQELDEDILKGVKGYQDCKIIKVKSEEALFYDGSKKETWKADMDGELDISNKDIKGSIDDVLAEDVF